MNKRDLAEYDSLIRQSTTLAAALKAVRDRMAELSPLPQHQPYRIALRPDDRKADPFAVTTLMDDIVVIGVPMFRAEAMTDKNWWVACYLDDDSNDRICWSVTARSKPLRIEWVTTEFPDAGPYEHEVRNR